jgi:S1-C subfamily serine protease
MTALLLLVTIAVSRSAAQTERGPFAQFTSEIEKIVRDAAPHLVQVVRGASEESAVASESPTRMIGTGIAFKDEHVLTSAGVVGLADEVDVVVGQMDTLRAKVVGVDRRTNVAVVHVPDLKAQPFPVAANPLLFPGDVVVVVGLGPPSGPEASFGTVVLVEGPNLGFTEVDMVQVTAPAFPGMTGGVLLNEHGEMVGMVSGHVRVAPDQVILPVDADMVSGYYQQNRLTTTASTGATVVLPVGWSVEIAHELLRGGVVERGYLGVQVELVHIGTKGSKRHFPGVMIHRVVPGGPADEAGLIPGDVILQYTHAKVTSPEDLSYLVAATRPGSTIPVLYLRRGGSRSLATVRIAQAPDLPWEPEMDALISHNDAKTALAPPGR